MAIDPGSKKNRIAISDENKIVATPYTTIIKENYADLLSQIKKIIEEHQIEGIVIGNPIIWMDLMAPLLNQQKI